VIGNEEVKFKLDQVLSFSSGDVRETYEKFGISGSVGGVLLHGPPGELLACFTPPPPLPRLLHSFLQGIRKLDL
jgi:hypothetical protein